MRYIGARYVPIFYTNSDDGSINWQMNVNYEPLIYVKDQNNHLYLSKKFVPDTVGHPADNISYWLDVTTFIGSTQELQDQIDEINDQLDTIAGGDQLYNALVKLNHKKIMVIGDSLSDNATYPPNWLDRVKACITANNLDIVVNTDMCINGSSWCGVANEALDNFDNYETDEFDIVLVALGINDFQGQFYCGKYTDSTLWHGDTYNLGVGIKLVLDKIRTKFPNALEYGIIPHRWNSNNAGTYKKPLALYRWFIGSMLLEYGARIIDWSSMPMFAPAVLGTFNSYVTSDVLHPQSAYSLIMATYTMEKLASGGDSTWRKSCDQTSFDAQDGSGTLRVSWYSDGSVEMRGREVLGSQTTLTVGYSFALFKDIPTEILESIDEFSINGTFDQTYPAVCYKDDPNKKIMVVTPYTGGTSTNVTIIDYSKNLQLYAPYGFGYGITD